MNRIIDSIVKDLLPREVLWRVWNLARQSYDFRFRPEEPATWAQAEMEFCEFLIDSSIGGPTPKTLKGVLRKARWIFIEKGELSPPHECWVYDAEKESLHCSNTSETSGWVYSAPKKVQELSERKRERYEEFIAHPEFLRFVLESMNRMKVVQTLSEGMQERLLQWESLSPEKQKKVIDDLTRIAHTRLVTVLDAFEIPEEAKKFLFPSPL